MTRRGQVEVSAGFVGRARVLTGLPFYHLSYTSLPTTYLDSWNASNIRSRHFSLTSPLQCSLGGPKWTLLGQLGYQGPRRLANKLAKCPTIDVSSRISRSLSEPSLARNGPKNKRASQREARGERRGTATSDGSHQDRPFAYTARRTMVAICYISYASIAKTSRRIMHGEDPALIFVLPSHTTLPRSLTFRPNKLTSESWQAERSVKREDGWPRACRLILNKSIVGRPPSV